MSLEHLLKKLLFVIAILTLLSGLVQLFMPGTLLRLLSGDTSAASTHFFATIGMFMAVIGGLLTQVLQQDRPDPAIIFWAALQKFGASALVAIGVKHGLFSNLALAVASFDLLSGLLALLYWRLISSRV